MRKLKIYLDTSVLNFYYAEDLPKEMSTTKELFKEIEQKKYEAFISATVVDEIEAADETTKNRLINLVSTYNLRILELSSEVDYLAGKYLQHGIIPQKYARDAYHIAYPVVYDLDIIISWNFEHIVKLKTKNEVNGINKLEGFKEIEICSPWEVIESED